MKICVIGVGHVGLVTSACFAHLGHDVIGVDSDIKKIRGLDKGEIPFYEPGLEKLIKENQKKRRLVFSSSIQAGVKNSEVVFICVGTPPREDGEADLSTVEKVVRDIACSLKSYRTIVEKSTVPVNTWQWIKHTVNLYNRDGAGFDVAVNPEFLREGSAVKDFLQPDRIVIGVESEKAEKALLEIYRKIDCPKIITNLSTAEIIKHASNSFLATKISFINSVAALCEKVGADVVKVSQGMGYDPRIGKAFLNAGAGYGGFCFPKDLAAFIHIGEKHGCDFAILKAVQKINEEQRKILVKKIKEALWVLKDKAIGVLGLAFKPDTDDLRLAPAIHIIRMLQQEGAKIKVFDPTAMTKAKKILKGVRFSRNPYEAARNSDCLVILTEWDEFRNLDLKKIKKLLKVPVVIDGRNIFDPIKMKKIGFVYKGMGR
jgi:UDPglucose 6-dehydrogenase